MKMAEVAKQAQIPQEMDMCEKSVATVKELTVELESRLQGLLRDEPTGGALPREPLELVGIASTIRAINNTAEETALILRNILDRLEV